MRHISLDGSVTAERYDFRRTIIAAKQTLEFDFARIEASRHVADDIGTSVERSGLFPLLGLPRREERRQRSFILDTRGELLAVFERYELLEEEDGRGCTWVRASRNSRPRYREGLEFDLRTGRLER
jgi:hypothetical protein